MVKKGNEITKIEGLESLRDLRELVLDKNKIKQIGELSFVGQSQRLIELHIEENRLRDLVNIQTLRNLQKLYAANNKINEFTDIEKLLDLGHLHEISLINNPVKNIIIISSQQWFFCRFTDYLIGFFEDFTSSTLSYYGCLPFETCSGSRSQ